MADAFHYSYFVTNLEDARRFYGDLLGCGEGRSTDDWVDFDFFGNQISCHRTDRMPETRNCGLVDGIAVPMPHFGAIVGWDDFHAMAARVEAAGVEFVVTPRSRFAGEPGEQATMFFCDPSGNAVEFKAFRHPEHVFTGHTTP